MNQLAALVETLRKAAIGNPRWVPEKDAFEYQDRSAKVAAVLKLVRAAHGVSAIDLLSSAGLFVDAGALVRCVNDAVSEIYFLLEEFPSRSGNVDQFIAEFFAGTIDGHLSDDTPQVPTKKVRSALVRVLTGSHDDATRKLLERIFRTFSGYVHASYSHIMEVYNGDTCDFNLRGVPSVVQRDMRMQYVDAVAISVLHEAAFIAQTLSLTDLHHAFITLEAWPAQAWRKQVARIAPSRCGDFRGTIRHTRSKSPHAFAKFCPLNYSCLPCPADPNHDLKPPARAAPPPARARSPSQNARRPIRPVTPLLPRLQRLHIQ